MPQLNHAADSPLRRPFLFSPELPYVKERCKRYGDGMEILVPQCVYQATGARPHRKGH
jgi:hypothetical protein